MNKKNAYDGTELFKYRHKTGCTVSTCTDKLTGDRHNTVTYRLFSQRTHDTLSKLKEASKANKEMLGTTPKKTTKTKMYNNISTVTMMKYMLINY